jgi:hypothetical protein
MREEPVDRIWVENATAAINARLRAQIKSPSRLK